MKKMISFILAAALSAAVAMPAFAAEPTTTKAADADTWTTAGENVDYAGDMMTMVAYEGGTIDVDSIQYIDQTTADENGAYKFENYIPKTLPAAGVVYNVKVGGENLDKAIDAGTIGTASTEPDDPTDTKVVVTGTASVIGKKTAKVAAIAAGAEADSKEIVGTANYELNVVPGTYDIAFTAEGYLSYTITGVPVAAELPALPAVELYAGDVDGNGDVTADDLGMMALAYNNADLYQSAYDVDNDGAITADDIGYAALRYKEGATVVAYADLAE